MEESSTCPVECESLVGEVETFLQELLTEMAAEPLVHTQGRPKVLPGFCLWVGMLVCVLRGYRSQHALWRLLSKRGLWHFPRFSVGDQAIYKRLAQGGTAPLEAIFDTLTRILQLRLAPYSARLAPFASGVYALDSSTLDAVGRYLPALREVGSKEHGLLPGRLYALFDVRLQQWKRVIHRANPDEHETNTAMEMVQDLPPKSLILADLGYYGFAWFDYLTDHDYYWVSRCKAHATYEVRHVFYEQGETLDALVWLGVHHQNQAAHAVRLVQFRIGATLYRYLTNVVDPKVLPMREVAALYARRWDIEMAFRTVKQHLGLRLLWSSKPVVVLIQVWAVLTISQVLWALRQEIAGRAGVEVETVSLPLMIEYLPQAAADGLDPVEWFLDVGWSAGFLRPSKRTIYKAPDVPRKAIRPLPKTLALTREPHYGYRKNRFKAS